MKVKGKGRCVRGKTGQTRVIRARIPRTKGEETKEGEEKISKRGYGYEKSTEMKGK